MKKLHILYFLSAALLFTLNSCEDEPDPVDEIVPVEMNDDKTWVDGEITAASELWYRVSCATNAATATIEWAEASAQGTKHNYTSDIQVSVYMLDGETLYIEQKDNGYAEKAKSFTLKGNESAFLVKVEIGPANIEGTFGIRATSAPAETGIITYTDLVLGDTWTEGTIEVDSVIAYKVKFGSATKLAIMWSEAGAPEDTYTADISGSVYRADETTVYTYEKDGSTKEFLDKNKSHSDEPKAIEVNTDDKNIKIQLKGLTAGTYAIKVVEVQ